MDKAEERALVRAEEYAYEAASGIINPEARENIFKSIRNFIKLGIRLMREEVENDSYSFNPHC